MVARFDDNGNLRISGNIISDKAWAGSTPMPAAQIALRNLQAYTIPMDAWAVWNTGLALPVVGADDDLGLVVGAFATSPPTLQTEDLQDVGAATTVYARASLILPPASVTMKPIGLASKSSRSLPFSWSLKAG